MRYNSFIKPFLYTLVLLILIYLYLSYNNRHNEEKFINDTSELKYILQWDIREYFTLVYMGEGQKEFKKRKCNYTNCFVTSDKSYLGDYRKFDAIVFGGSDLALASKYSLPDKRSLHQKFVFASMESSANYPACSDKLDNFFNWTWTYKVNSDISWGYMTVRDSNNTYIGPNAEMHWLKVSEMDAASNEVKKKLKTKTKAAAWFVSNCNSRNCRETFVNDLNEQLKRYKLNVDIYGRCGSMNCSRENHNECVKKIGIDYYFYLSFENSFAEDYVTEKLLTALNNNAVPIVYGAANYTRYMPDGIYLNARELGAEKLAEKMNELILNPDLYADYFGWQNHYSYHRRSESIEADDYCRFCSMLNNKELVQKITTYPNFRQWWDPPNRC